MSTDKAYKLFLVVSGVLLVGWGLGYGYETYRYTACSDIANTRIGALNAQIDEARKKLEQSK
ncbi:MAG: hypothetical protein ACXWJW_03695 [Xanthobacteraceae bacterium]